MNPARLVVIYSAYFQTGRTDQALVSSRQERAEEAPRSLSAYLMGGG